MLYTPILFVVSILKHLFFIVRAILQYGTRFNSLFEVFLNQFFYWNLWNGIQTLQITKYTFVFHQYISIKVHLFMNLLSHVICLYWINCIGHRSNGFSWSIHCICVKWKCFLIESRFYMYIQLALKFDLPWLTGNEWNKLTSLSKSNRIEWKWNVLILKGFNKNLQATLTISFY